MFDPVQTAAKDTPSVDKLFGRYTIWGWNEDDVLTPYMTRYWFGRLRLHIFHRGDNDPDPHDHPWDFWTFPLTSYVEEVTEFTGEIKDGFREDGARRPGSPDGPEYERYRRIVRAFRLHFRKATHTHRVIGRFSHAQTFNYGSGGIIHPPILHTKPGKIVTLVWRGSIGRKWGFLKNRDGRWCWIPWKEYVFNGGKHGPCE